MKCECRDWEENINELNAGTVMKALHGWGGYSGKKFVYCPWCGNKLEADVVQR